MLNIIAARIAAPRMMLNMKALMPIRVKPSFSTPSTVAPISPPMMVPEPPASCVPPITPAATARNMIWLPPACGSIEPMRNAFQAAGEPGEQAAQHEIADLQAGHLDAGFARADLVGAGSDGVQAPARVAKHHVQDER